MQPWKTLERHLILDHSRFLKVESHTVQLPDGQIIPDWSWIVTPDFVNVVAITEQGDFLCFRQSKYGVKGLTLAPVGGYIEADEEPLLAAQRELREETGYEAPDWHHLGSFAVGGNRGIATAHLFLAENAYYVTPADADDLEEQELLLMSRDEVEKAMMAGEFKVVSWTTAVALALRVLEQR